MDRKGMNVPGDALIFKLFKYSTPAGKEQTLYPILEEVVERAGFAFTIDRAGNFIVDTDLDPQTVFTAHLDDVAWSRKKRRIQIKHGIISVAGGGVLGADDKAGVWLLCKMIQAKVKGRYIFTTGEEVGGIGSTSLDPKYLKGIKRAVGFDRKGTESVITKQAGSVCCSNEFGNALADALGLVADPTGIFTDTHNWTHLVPECTNVSVGYRNAHTESEKLDYWWLSRVLLPRVLRTDWNALPTVREAKREIDSWRTGIGNFDDFSYFSHQTKDRGTKVKKKAPGSVQAIPMGKLGDHGGKKSATLGASMVVHGSGDPVDCMSKGAPCPWTDCDTCTRCWMASDCDFAHKGEALYYEIDESLMETLNNRKAR